MTLMTLQTRMPFTSPNRSIFDEDSSDCSSRANEDLEALETALEHVVEKRENTYSVSSDEGNFNSKLEEAMKKNVLANHEIVLLKASLLKMKKRIEELEMEHSSNPGKACEGMPGSTEPPLKSAGEKSKTSDTVDNLLTNEHSIGESSIDVSFLFDPKLSNELKDYEDSVRKADLVVIQNLKSRLSCPRPDHSNDLSSRSNDENFTTEWTQVSPLPPPPDHGLQSPIVNTIFEQWTDDESMHNSLIEWMENILDNSSYSDDIMPLKISHLVGLELERFRCDYVTPHPLTCLFSFRIIGFETAL